MRKQDNEPLPFDLWLSELDELALRCSEDPVDGEDRAVRRAFHLFQLSPPVIQALSDPCLDESDIELAIERNGHQAAARLIFGRHACVELASSLSPGRWSAVVSFGEGASGSGEADSPTLAMICAWANALRKPG